MRIFTQSAGMLVTQAAAPALHLHDHKLDKLDLVLCYAAAACVSLCSPNAQCLRARPQG